MAVWVLGLSGCGKSTLISRLQTILNCDCIYVGEIIRAIYPPRSILGVTIPEKEIFSIVSTRLESTSTNLVLIDNYPINRGQLDRWLKRFPPPKLVLYLETTDKVVEARRGKRGRFDDTDISYVSRKLKFEEETLPMIQYLGDKVIKLDACKLPRELLEDAYKAIRDTFLKLRLNYCDGTSLNVERRSDVAKLPAKRLPFSAGYDLYLTESALIPGYKTVVQSTHLSVEIPGRTVGLLSGRSSTSVKGLLVHPGILDTGFSESVKIIISNLTSENIFIEKQTAVAQVTFLPIFCPEVIEQTTVKPGRSGLGSTNHVSDIGRMDTES